MFQAWRARRRRARAVQRALDALFADPRRLSGSSLRPDHRSRVDLHSYEWDEDSASPREVRFIIVRHPRPYQFSRQHHEVAELYAWECGTDRITVEQSLNLTRQRNEWG